MKIVVLAMAMMITILLVPALGWSQNSNASQAIRSVERTALFPTPAMIEAGENVAEVNCADCHGMDGISDTEGKPHLAGQRAVYLYRVLKAFQTGERPDQEKKHNNFLQDEALLSTSVFYASLSPVEITAPISAGEEGEVDDAEEDTFQTIRDDMRKCIKCHGETGNITRSGMANLTAQDPEYFVASMLAYINGSRSHRLMKKLVGNLDEADIREMGVFYAVQEPLQSETQGEGDPNVGRRLSEDCKNCHGDGGNTNKPDMPSLAGQDAKYFIKAMKHYKDRERQHQKMFEAVEALSEQDMIDLATYYAAGEPLRRNVNPPLKSTQWIARCERCHGINGNSNDPRFPMLAGQDETYLRQALKGYASGIRANTIMHSMAEPLSALSIDRIGAYFASQQPKTVVYMRLPCEDEKNN